MLSSDPIWPIRANSHGQVVRRPRCPVCSTMNVRCETTRDGANGTKIRHYVCRECLDLHSRKPTRFKVTVI